MFKGLLAYLHNIDPDEKHIFGRGGEAYIKELLIKNKYKIYCNRIIENHRKKSHFLESDIILNKGNSIFVIEIKRMKGRIFRTDRGLIQEKIPALNPFLKKLNPYEARTIKNPKDQAKHFTTALKKNLVQRDRRFLAVRFIPVAVFSNEADISDIYSFEDGIIYFSDLINFIEKNSSDNTSPDWIDGDLKSLKGFDILINRNEREIMGIIVDSDFICTTKEEERKVSFRDIKNIKVKRGNIFSTYDNIIILLKSGEVLDLNCRSSTIRLNTFSSVQTHFLRNLIEVKVESK